MSPRIIVRPPSKASSIVSPDEIPPQPLDLDQNEAEPPPSHDPNHRDERWPHETVDSNINHPNPRPTSFYKLPVEVIQKILWMVDANTFASLVLLNRTWYNIAQNLELYAHHLSRCPSYALANTVITGPFRKNDLLRLKSKFAAEVRRNLFEAYQHPRHTLINLISVNASSSAALPGAEAFRFSFSPNGRTILALSSSRIYVIDATSDTIQVRRELKTMRRPLSASVTDDGSILAVLSSKYQANIYHLTDTGVKHSQVLVMDNPPRTITLAPEGTVLAAAYEGGVEVFSLAPNALSTDRRAVRSEAVDSLNFSGDGSMLVGSTQSLEEPSAVVITAPFYTENDLPPKEVHSRMWTTQILFPQISSICSHAELLHGHTEGDASWLFAYDHTLMSYRAVRTDDTRTGVAYFLNPTTNRRFSTPAPCTAPTATACGTLVVAGFSGSGLWIYGVPEKLDVCPDMGSVIESYERRLQGGVRLTSATGHLEPLMAYSPTMSGSSESIEDDSIAAKVDWRGSLFVKCQQIRGLESCTSAKWVEKSEEQGAAFHGKRLIVVGPGGVDQFVEELGDETMPVDGSRVSILDFDYSPSTGQNREITIEVGDNEPELLAEQMSDMDIEVAMERRRTVRDRGRGTKLSLGRSVTTAAARRSSQRSSRNKNSLRPSSPLDVDAQMALSAAQSQTHQPNAANLYRSATAAGFTTARYPPRPPLSVQQQNPPYMPSPPSFPSHGWESPPPPYPTSQHGPVPSGMSLGLPSAQSSAAGIPRPMDLGLGGIPEYDLTPTRNQVHPARQALDRGHIAATDQYQAHGRLQSHSSTYTTASGPAQAGCYPGHFGLAQHNGFHQARASSPFRPGNPSDLHARPSHHEERVTPSQTPGHGHTFRPNQPIQAPPGSYPTTQPPERQSTIGSITLTGANLQARLNHPVPPTPPSLEEMGLPAEPPDKRSRPNHADQSPAQMRGDLSTQYSVAPPTPDQMANLNRRVSQTLHESVSPISPNDDSPQTRTADTLYKSRDTSAPLSTPRAAWGAAGVPGLPSFQKAANLSNGLSRSNSRSSGRSMPFSASTPNLHSTTGRYGERPGVGRLDTIESVSSSYGPGEPGSRSHTFTSGVVPTSVTGTRERINERHVYSGSQPQFQQARTNQTFMYAGSGDPGHGAAMLEPSKKKGKRRTYEPGRERTQSVPMSTSDGPISKKEKRCTVM